MQRPVDVSCMLLLDLFFLIFQDREEKKQIRFIHSDL